MTLFYFPFSFTFTRSSFSLQLSMWESCSFYTPIMVWNTIYMLMTPKFWSLTHTSLSCCRIIHPNWLLEINNQMTNKCLKLNISRTEILILPFKCAPPEVCPSSINGNSILPLSSCLGVIFDSSLSLMPFIQSSGTFKRIWSLLATSSRITLVQDTVIPPLLSLSLPIVCSQKKSPSNTFKI